MTFLEFVCERLLGPPTSSSGEGESTWPCPKCGHCRWHTLPPKPPYKDRFRCWVCPFRGDEFDLLLHFHPREHYGDRKARVADLRREFEAAVESDPGVAVDSYSFRGPGKPEPKHFLDPRKVALAWDGLTDDECTTLIAARRVMWDKAGEVSFDALSDYCLDFRNWMEETAAVRRLMEEERQAASKPSKPFPKASNNGRPSR